MNIFSWNCHYGLTRNKLNKVLGYENIDIYLIQECKKQDLELIDDKYEKFWFGDSIDSAGDPNRELGICIFAEKQFFHVSSLNSFQEVSKNRYVVPYQVIDNKSEEKYIICNVWTKPKDGDGNTYKNYHIPIFNMLNHNKPLINEEKIIMIGDFNTGSIENTKSEKWLSLLKEKLIKYDLIIILDKDSEFKSTYFHNANGKYYVNDHCFVSKKVDELFNLRIKILDFDEEISGSDKFEGLSDHTPIILEINPS